MTLDAAATRRLPLAIALVSAGALAYQLLLMRWLAIAHWHPFAVMIISLALLGHGASGTWLSLWLQRRGVAQLHAGFEMLFARCALLFAATSVGVLVVARLIAFNGLELVWNVRQLLWLAALYLTLSVPFFFAAACFGLAFARFGARIPALYGADLVGAGLGAIAALALAWLPVQHGVLATAACGAGAAWRVTPRPWQKACAIALLAVFALLWMTPAIAPRTNDYKGLSKALLLPGARVVAERSGPHGWLAVVESARVPLRHAPGLSLSHAQEPPRQLALYTDGDAMTAIVRDDAAHGHWLDAMTSALPYHLRTPDTVLVLGAGGGMEVLQALSLGARHVDAVEPSAQRLRLVREDFAAYTGDLLRDRRVRAFVAEPRAFVRASARRYDLIVLAGGESFASGGAGAQSSSEQYALTVEALREYLSALTPHGMIVATRWSRQPPRDELKLLATAIEALHAQRLGEPSAHVAVIRNWDAGTWLFARSPLTSRDVAALRGFADRLGFDVVHAPGPPGGGERFHVLEPPTLYEGVRALLSLRARDYLRDYKFDIVPAHDDRPYFGHSFRWRSLPELVRLRGQGSAVLLDSGYLLLAAALVQAIPLALVLVVLPLRALPRPVQANGFTRTRAGLYFLALGLAFLIVEIATLARLTLIVGHPILAANLGLACVLLFAGLGSLAAQRWLSQGDADDAAIARRAGWAVRAIVFGLLWQFAVFAFVHAFAPAWPIALRALLGLAGIAPLAFAMGMPFPLGLARLARNAPAFVPWAWGLNGCASVIAAILAVLLAIALGLRATLLIAAALYLFAAWVWPAQYRSMGSTSSDQRTRRASGEA